METEQNTEPVELQAGGAEAPEAKPEPVSLEQIQAAAREAAVAAAKEVQANQPDMPDVEGLLSRQKQQIANAILGKEADPGISPVLQNFVNNPEAVLAQLKEMTKEELRTETAEQQETLRNAQSVIQNTLSDRPDVTGSERAKKLVGAFVAQTDQNLSFEDRLKEGLKQYDLHLEELGANDAKARIAAAAGVSSSGSGSTSVTPPAKSEEQLRKEEQDERLEHFRKSRGRNYK